MEFGTRAEPVPEGTKIVWDFGDGTTAEGQVVSHAFARAGEYRVTMRVEDSGDPRSATSLVRVVRRPPAAAVPPNVASAFIFDRFFARLPKHLELIERFFGSERTSAAISAAEEILGVDPTRPEQLDAAGIDPEEGLVICALPDDTGTWVITGVLDEAKALAAAKASLSRKFGAPFVEAPHGFSSITSGDSVAYAGAMGGYLYVRLPAKEGRQQTANLALLATMPPEGLFSDATFSTARAAVPGEDLFVFGRASEVWKLHRPTGPLSKLQGGASALSLGVSLGEQQVDLDMLLSMDAQGVQSLGSLFGAPAALPAAKLAPPGATGYVSAALAPELLRELVKDEPEDLAMLGPGAALLRELVRVSRGALTAAIYFDVAGLYRDLAARQEPSPKFNFVATAELQDAEKAKALVHETAAALLAPHRRKAPEDRLLFSFEGVPGGVTNRDATVIFGYGEVFGAALDPDAQARRLQSKLERSLPPGATEGGHLLLYVDVGTLVDELRSPPPIPDVSPGQLMFMRSFVSTLLEDPSSPARPLLPIRDAVLRVAPGPNGLTATGSIRLRN